MNLKQFPEDFIVKEIFDISKLLTKSGDYHIYLLSKINLSTPEAISKLSRILSLRESSFGYAGNKDKRARTEQYISIKGKKARGIDDANLKMEYKGRSKEPISLGDHDGNQFEITLRGITPEEHKAFINNTKNKTIRFPNFFGEQRFSKDNAVIGKHIIKKEFGKAVHLLQHEEKVRLHHDRHPNDAVGALRQIPKRTLRLFIHAYQSELFNHMLRSHMLKNIEKEVLHTLPLIGFATPETAEVKIICKSEGISLRDFIIPQIPESSSEGSQRKSFETCHDVEIIKSEKDSMTFHFSLPKGCYATVLLDFLFSPETIS